MELLEMFGFFRKTFLRNLGSVFQVDLLIRKIRYCLRILDMINVLCFVKGISRHKVASCIIYYLKKKRLIKFLNSLEEEVWKMLKAQGYTSEAIVQTKSHGCFTVFIKRSDFDVCCCSKNH